MPKGPDWPWVVKAREASRAARAKQPYKSQSKKPWEPIASVPEGMRWKPEGARSTRAVRMLSTPGGQYRLIRDLKTGEVQYFKLAGTDAPATPKEKIDAEPAKKGQVRYRVGANAWFVIDGRWFLIRVVKREPGVIVIAPVNAMDADRKAKWPHPPELEFSPASNTFSHLRPLKARYA